jgi:hypothetical protein
MHTNISQSLAVAFNAGTTDAVLAKIGEMSPYEAALVVSDMRELLTFSCTMQLTRLMRDRVAVRVS